MDKETFDNHEESEESEESEVQTYPINNVIIALASVALIYFLVKRPRRVIVENSRPSGTLMTNVIILTVLAAIYYFYNKNSLGGYSLSKTNNSNNPHVYPRFTNIPEIDERNIKLQDGSIESHLKYFKRFNRPLVKEIKSGLNSFNDKKTIIMEQEVNTFLVQELDNLNFTKDKILESAESLIFSIDIANVKTEQIYNEFNGKLKHYLENSYNETKKYAKMKKSDNIKNCLADIDVFSGVLMSDQEVTPSNY